MISTKLFITLAFLTGWYSGTAYAQHRHVERVEADSSQVSMLFTHVMSQALSDPEIAGYKMEASVMTVPPGAVDTVSHRHDCDLFGYVLEGNIELGFESGEPKRYSAGQMFYEKRNTLHTYTRNPDGKAIRILLVFIIKDGRSGYTAEYKDRTKLH